ncbi:MAG: helix-turn-helix domain-containing protein, partial [Clostridiales bacterium]|nr:helix-turn-helix domain-containing protein [Clostridiales bacterium]
MLYNVEIKNGKQSSCVITIRRLTAKQHQWLDQICIYFVLEGSTRITTKAASERLNAGDLLLVNCYASHEIAPESESIIYCLRINPEYYDSFYSNFSESKFDLNSSKVTGHGINNLTLIKYIMAKIIQIVDSHAKFYLISVEQYLHELVKLLLNKYLQGENTPGGNLHEEEKRLFRIAEFIEKNYKKDLSLTLLAEREHLNSQYFSRFFSKKMGVTLKTYIFKVRLQKSLEDLLNSTKTITETALDNGFSDLKSYYKEFRQEYGITPAKFRDSNKTVKVPLTSKDDYKILSDTESVQLKLTPYLEVLSIDNSFLNFQLLNELQDNIPETGNHYDINYRQNTGLLNKSWQKIARCDRASDILTSRWKAELEEIQKDLKIEYILIRNIFSKELLLFNQDVSISWVYNFSLIDEVLQNLLDRNIIPIIELSPIPEHLIQNRTSGLDYPDELDKWENLIQAFFRHLFGNYHLEKLKTWQFQLWYDPRWKRASINDRIRSFLRSTIKTIAGSHAEYKQLCIGLFQSYEPDAYFTPDSASMDFDPIKLSFLSISLKSLYSADQEAKSSRLDSKRNVDDILAAICSDISHSGFSNQQIYLMDWNEFETDKSLLNDTCFKASSLLRKILYNHENATLIIDQLFSQPLSPIIRLFNGDNSMITRNSIKKATFYTYLLLSKLGETLIKKGDNYLATKKKDGSLQIITQNYCGISQALTA